MLSEVIDVEMHHVKRGRANNVLGDRGSRQRHQADLRDAPCKSFQAEREFARNLKEYQSTFRRCIKDFSDQKALESDMFQNIAVNDQIGLASNRI